MDRVRGGMVRFMIVIRWFMLVRLEVLFMIGGASQIAVQVVAGKTHA